MQDHVALLRRLRFQIGQPLPRFQILRANDAALRDGRRKIAARGLRVFPLGAEQSVNPAVFVPHEPHVIDVDVRIVGLGQDDGIIPKAETIDAACAFGDGEKALAIDPFDAGDEINPPVEFDRAGIEHAVDAQSLHQMRIRLVIQIVTPKDRRMLGGQHGIPIAMKHAVAFGVRLVGPIDQRSMFGKKLLQTFVEFFARHSLVLRGIMRIECGE